MIQTPKINLIHGDCMDLPRKTPDNHYSISIVDPPYGIGKALTTWSHTDKALSKVSVDWDIVPDKEYFQELMRVSKNQIIWGGNNFLLPPTNCFLIWEKPNKMHTLADCEYAWTSFSSPAKMTRVNRVTKKQNTHNPKTRCPLQMAPDQLRQARRQDPGHARRKHVDSNRLFRSWF